MSRVLWIMLQWAQEYRCLSKMGVSFFSEKHREVGLLGHVVALLLTFWAPSTPLSTAAVPVCSPTSRHEAPFPRRPHQHYCVLFSFSFSWWWPSWWARAGGFDFSHNQYVEYLLCLLAVKYIFDLNFTCFFLLKILSVATRKMSEETPNQHLCGGTRHCSSLWGHIVLWHLILGLLWTWGWKAVHPVLWAS